MGLIANSLIKLKQATWNRMQRIQRKGKFPKFKGLQQARVLTIGRLLVDTFLAAKELIKSNDYSLDFLAKKYLNERQTKIESNLTKEYMENAELIQTFYTQNENDARLTFAVMQKLQVLALTK